MITAFSLIKTRVRHFRVLLTLAISILLVGSFGISHAEIKDSSEITTKTTIAQTLAEAVLSEIDNGVYVLDHRYASTFKGLVTQEQWRDKLTAVRVPLGKVITRGVLSSSYNTILPGAPDGEYVVLQFETQFENKKTAVETVIMVLENKESDEWKLTSYFIK